LKIQLARRNADAVMWLGTDIHHKNSGLGFTRFNKEKGFNHSYELYYGWGKD
jgi:hypothetical protein